MQIWRYAPSGDLGNTYAGSYDGWLVLLSVCVASMAAFVALAVVRRISLLAEPRARRAWKAVGAVSMGLGVWAMHFTGMLAFSLPVAVGYQPFGTALSVVPAIVGGFVALDIMIRESSEWWRLQLGGLSLALGIGAMHYVGMEAMLADATLRYDPFLFAISILVAHVLATGALYVRFALMTGDEQGMLVHAASAGLMGIAVSGMHYTAMRAARFYPNPEPIAPSMVIPPALLATLIIGATTFFLALAMVGMAMDRRMVAAHDSARDSASRHRALLEALADGFVTLTRSGLIETVNPAAQQMFGYPADAMVGRRIWEVIPALDPGGAAQGDWFELVLLESEAEGRAADGRFIPIELSGSSAAIGAEPIISLVIRDVSSRREVELERRRLAMAVEQASEAIAMTDLDGAIEYANPAFSAMTGYTRAECVGLYAGLFDPAVSDPEERLAVLSMLCAGQVWSGSAVYQRLDGTAYDAESTYSSIKSAEGEPVGFVEIRRDVTERHLLERQLDSARKLESIGQLAAGIAHEINTPTQYVGDNTRFLQDGFTDLLELIERFQALSAAARQGTVPAELVDEVEAATQRADLDYLVEEIPRAIGQSLEGVERVTKIVRAMKEFSHPSVEKTPTDLNAAMQSTATVATNEWKYVAELVTDFDEALPPVPVVPGEFNQVVLNMIVNAAHAIADVVGDGSTGKGTITLRSKLCGEWVEVRIEDSGKGMPPEVRERIFDPFFTTKEVEKGTGQGLSIAHAVVTQKHGGRISVDSSPGGGTRFLIQLPLDDPAPDVRDLDTVPEEAVA